MKRRWPFLVIGLAISLGLLWVALGDLPMAQVWAAIKQANYLWLIPGVGIYFLSVWFRAWRWGFLLRNIRPLSATHLFPVVVIGYMGNNILPFRLGEVLRAYVLWRKEGINVGTTLTTALVERLFDGLTMVLLVLFGLLFIPMSAFLSRLITVASVVFFGALAVFLFLAARPNLLRRLARIFIDHLVPSRFRPGLWGFAEGVIVGLERLQSARDVLTVFGVTVWLWVLEMFKYWLVSFAFDLRVPYVGIVLMGGAVNLLTALPSLPGYIGTFELGIKVLEGIGAPSALAASYVLVLHAILLLPVTLLGLIFMAVEGVHWAEVGEVARAQR